LATRDIEHLFGQGAGKWVFRNGEPGGLPVRFDAQSTEAVKLSRSLYPDMRTTRSRALAVGGPPPGPECGPPPRRREQGATRERGLPAGWP